MVNFDYLSTNKPNTSTINSNRGSFLSGGIANLISPTLSSTVNTPQSDRDLLAGVIYAESNPNDSTDPAKVASVINNRSKITGKDPLSVISYGFTSVGQDSKSRFEPFLQGKVDSESTKKSAYDLADELLAGKFKSPYLYTRFSHPQGKIGNVYDSSYPGTDAWADPNILRQRFTKETKRETPNLISAMDILTKPKQPILTPAGDSLLRKTKDMGKSILPGVAAGVESINQRSIEPYKKYLIETAKKANTPEGLNMMVAGTLGQEGNLIKKTISEAGGEIVPEIENTISKITNILKEAKPVRGQQEKLYTEERARRIAQAEAVGQKTSGEAGFHAELSQLKGELPKAEFENIANQVNQKEIDDLFNHIKQSGVLDQWDSITARTGLSKIFNGSVPTEGEIALLEKVFPKKFVDAVLSKRTAFEKFKEAGLKFANIPRSLQASFDLSAPFRQGVTLLSHPTRFFQAFKEMFKTFGNEDAFKGIEEAIIQKPTFNFMKEGGLALTDLKTSMINREEKFMSNWAEKFPGENVPIIGKLSKVYNSTIGLVVRASSRAYTGFLKKLRADVFEDLFNKAEQLGLNPKSNPDLVKEIADFVNNASGRGSKIFGYNIGKNAEALNAFFFSPRLIASRTTLLNPMYYVRANPLVRREALKSLFVLSSYWTTIAGLAKLAGAEVGIDPRSADFGKIKIGNTRVDVGGGFQQYLRMGAQLLTGKYISTTTGKEYTLGEGYKPVTRLDILGRQVESKEAPIFSFITDLLRGQDYAGNKINVPKEIVQRFVPMVLQDIVDLAKQDPSLIPVGLLGAFGMGVQTYTPKKSSHRNFNYLNK